MLLDHPPGLEMCATVSGAELYDDAGCHDSSHDDATTFSGYSSVGEFEIEVELGEDASHIISGIAEDMSSRKLEGKWVDRCGVIGVVKDKVLYWTHPVDNVQATEIVFLDANHVRIDFLGAPMYGLISEDELTWSSQDVWWRETYDAHVV
jgi:hypothetical protein